VILSLKPVDWQAVFCNYGFQFGFWASLAEPRYLCRFEQTIILVKQDYATYKKLGWGDTPQATRPTGCFLVATTGARNLQVALYNQYNLEDF
jgi:hypothetical protein